MKILALLLFLGVHTPFYAGDLMTWQAAVERRHRLATIYPLAKNIGGEWIKKTPRRPSPPPWWRFMPTGLYLVAQSIQQRDEARKTGWQSYQNNDYGFGLEWRILF